jgi:hypothetical protein
MERKEGYESPAAQNCVRFACCALHFSRLTNKFIRSLDIFVKSLCVYTKIIQGIDTLLDLLRSKSGSRGEVLRSNFSAGKTQTIAPATIAASAVQDSA